MTPKDMCDLYNECPLRGTCNTFYMDDGYHLNCTGEDLVMDLLFMGIVCYIAFGLIRGNA
jgi:hypothetical protein